LFSPGHDIENVVTSLALITMVVIAARQDLIEHRIPNILTVGALGAGLLMQSIFGGLNGLLVALAGAGVGLACLLPFYLLKGTAAGDVKLMSAVGAFLGPANAFLAAALTLVFGAVIAAAIVLWRLVESRAALSDSPSGNGAAAGTAPATIAIVRKERFPYAVAIGLGAIMTLWVRGMPDILLHGLGSG
jgi:prepilin peptidase CpaA